MYMIYLYHYNAQNVQELYETLPHEKIKERVS